MEMDQYKGCLVMADVLIKMLLVHCSRFPQRRHTLYQPLPGSFVLICSCSLFHPDLPIKFYSFIHSFIRITCFFLFSVVAERCWRVLIEQHFTFLSVVQFIFQQHLSCKSLLLLSIQHFWGFIAVGYSSCCLPDWKLHWSYQIC